MNVLVNGTTLNVTNAYAEREEATGIITYYIILPQSEMDYNALKALFKNNTEEIVKNDDEGNTELFANAEYEHIIDDDTNGLYTVILKTNENKHQLARNRQLEADKANLEGTVASKEAEISNLNTTVAEKDKAIAEREATIEAKDNMISEKDTVIGEKEVVITEQKETIATLEAEIVELKNSVGTGEVDLSEFASALEEGVNDYE